MSRLEVAESLEPRSDAESEELDFGGEESDDGSDIEIDVDNDIEKDESEEELEQLVFGDDKGFRSGLKTFVSGQEQQGYENQQLGTGLEGLNDADVGQAFGWYKFMTGQS